MRKAVIIMNLKEGTHRETQVEYKMPSPEDFIRTFSVFARGDLAQGKKLPFFTTAPLGIALHAVAKIRTEDCDDVGIDISEVAEIAKQSEDDLRKNLEQAGDILEAWTKIARSFVLKQNK